MSAYHTYGPVGWGEGMGITTGMVGWVGGWEEGMSVGEIGTSFSFPFLNLEQYTLVVRSYHMHGLVGGVSDRDRYFFF